MSSEDCSRYSEKQMKPNRKTNWQYQDNLIENLRKKQSKIWQKKQNNQKNAVEMQTQQQQYSLFNEQALTVTF